jgi:nitrite reductase (NADH) small subunit
MGSDAIETEAGRHVVATADEIGPGQRKVVRIGRREIGIFNVDGELYGVRNICPHRTGPLCLGRLRPYITWEGAEMVFERENEILKCPWHQYEFDIKTGECMVDPDLRVRAYRVEQEGDEVVLYV